MLGFDLVLRYGPSASFLSAGGYHHHIGVNTWSGTALPPPDAVGLRWFVIQLPNVDALNQIVAHTHRLGITPEETEDGLLLQDPVHNKIVLTQ